MAIFCFNLLLKAYWACFCENLVILGLFFRICHHAFYLIYLLIFRFVAFSCQRMLDLFFGQITCEVGTCLCYFCRVNFEKPTLAKATAMEQEKCT